MLAEREHLPPISGRLFMPTLRLQGDLPAAAGPSGHELCASTGRDFQFGVLLHGGCDAHWQQARCALESLTELGVGARRLLVLSAHCLHRGLQAAAQPTLSKSDECFDAGSKLWARLLLHWCTPLHLVSRAKIEAGHLCTPPSALAVVRSLRRRVVVLEPAWAQALGLFESDWIKVEEALRQPTSSTQAGISNRMRSVTWRYGSRTKLAPFTRSGLVGCQAFCVPARVSILGLLSVGAWLGAGESTGFGCGHFRWRMRLANGQYAQPLLGQPWAGVNGSLLV